jgi:hypothetical protein
MEVVTLIIAVVALVVAVLAYARTGGIQELRGQVSALGSAKESLRVKTTDTLGAVRTKTADTLDRLEKAVRRSGETPPPPVAEEKGSVPEEKKSTPEEKKSALEQKKKEQ